MSREKEHIESAAGTPRYAIRAAFVLVGGAALMIQVLLMRELIAAWRGDEMSIGVALSVWLVAGGLGSLAFALVPRSAPGSRLPLARGLLVLAAMAPLSLVGARLARAALGLTAGELAGFPALLVASAVALAPYALISGFLFPLGIAVMESQAGRRRSPAGQLYVTEAAGAVASGLAMSFLILPHLDPLRTTFLASLALSVSALMVLATENRRARHRLSASAWVAVAATVAAAVALGPYTERIDDALVSLHWRNLGFRAQSNSVYGRIVGTQMGSQMSLYASGVLAASQPDRLSAEETVHLAMLQHRDPTSVLLLGGGLAGVTEEILKHPGVAHLDYVELDPELIRASERTFGPAMTRGLDDPRITVHYEDARFFVKRADDRYDVVLIGAPDPTTAQLNRYYTADFLRELSRILDDDGLMAMSVQSAENYVGRELAAFLGCLRATAESVFPSVVMLPGDPCHLFAAGEGVALTRNAETLEARIAERELDILYVRGYYLRDRLSPERLSSFDLSLAAAEERVNTDLVPSCYYLTLVLRNRQFAGVPDLLLAAPRMVSRAGAAAVGVAIVGLLGLSSLGRRRRAGRYRRGVVAAVLVVGATEMAMEITALMAFQSMYGYVYRELAIIVAAFMAGLAIGGLAGVRVARAASRTAFTVLQLAITAVPLALASTISAISRLPAQQLLSWSALFPLVVVGSAALAGVQFPIAAALLSAPSRGAGAVGGRLYGADLIGAAAGAVVTSVFLLPILGIVGTMQSFAIINACVLGWLILAGVSPARTTGTT